MEALKQLIKDVETETGNITRIQSAARVLGATSAYFDINSNNSCSVRIGSSCLSQDERDILAATLHKIAEQRQLLLDPKVNKLNTVSDLLTD